jgi:hypothetical protein
MDEGLTEMPNMQYNKNQIIPEEMRLEITCDVS